MLASARAVELDSESYLARVLQQQVLHFSGKWKESVAAAQIALAMSGRHPWSMVFLASTFSESGKAANADAVYEEMRGRARHEYLSPALLAFGAAAASRKNEVIRHAREAVEIRDPQCQFVFSRHAPWRALLYADPRFREIISSLGRTDWLRD